MLHMLRSEYLSTLGGENNVRCQFLSVCKHCLVLLTLFLSDMKISHECLNFTFQGAKFKGLRYSHQM